MLPKWLLPAPSKVGKHIIETIHDFKLVIDPAKDQGVELSLFESGTYEKGILHFIKTHYDPKRSFVDVGANIGLMSIFCAKKFPGANVIAYEANPETFEILEQNALINNIDIEMHQLACGENPGTATIYDNWSINRGGASIKVQAENAIESEVEMIVLDDQLQSTPGMIKIDVEGFEYEVLKGLKRTIETSHPTLIIEVSQKRDGNTREVYDFISAFGIYDLFKLKGGKERISPLVKIDSFEDLPDHDNIICIANS